MVDTLVLRPYNRREEEERTARYAARINHFIRHHPHLVAECQDMTADPIPDGIREMSLEYLLLGREPAPGITSAQIAVTGRNSERIRAMAGLSAESAKPQPRSSKLSDIYRAIEAEVNGQNSN